MFSIGCVLRDELNLVLLDIYHEATS